MNLLLLHPQDFTGDNRVIIQGRRHQHLKSVHRATTGSELKAGLIDGLIGSAIVEDIDDNQAILTTSFQQSPPPPLPLTLVLALPRPKMLKRTFETIATMGVKELILLNSYRVEKSYWQTPFLSKEKINEHLILGAEQGVDTRLPTVSMEKRFKPFVEDRLPQLCQNKRALVAHPKHAHACPNASQEETLLVIGPEGGFIDYEIEKLNQAGCKTIHLGSRILRVETAVPVLLAKLFPVL
ncbi:MAG: 16S rRNA (uracil(1498)-N(3))-methyltransferase [Cellvibrionaceae bacterium]